MSVSIPSRVMSLMCQPSMAFSADVHANESSVQSAIWCISQERSTVDYSPSPKRGKKTEDHNHNVSPCLSADS